MLEYQTFYCSYHPSAGYDLETLKGSALSRAEMPLMVGPYNLDIHEAFFTTSDQMRDLLLDFEQQLATEPRVQAVTAMASGDHQALIKIREGLSTHLDKRYADRALIVAYSQAAKDGVIDHRLMFESSKLFGQGRKPLLPSQAAIWLALTYRRRLPDFPQLQAALADLKSEAAEAKIAKVS